MTCVVRDCKSFWDATSGIKLHSFPKDPSRRRDWLSRIVLKGKFYETAKICSKHFKSEDYSLDTGKLLKTAIPFYTHMLCECCSLVKCENGIGTLQSSTDVDGTHNLACSPVSILEHENNLQSTIVVDKTHTLVTPSSLYIVDHDYEISTSLPADTVSETLVRLTAPTVHMLVEEYNSSIKRRKFRDLGIQVKLKTNRELILQKKTKILLQKIKRQEDKIKTMKKLVDVLLQACAPPSLQNSPSFTRIINSKKRKLYQLLSTHDSLTE